jgi:hypothetical protein
MSETDERERQGLMCEELIDLGLLTPWEQQFVENMAQLVARGWELTGAQNYKLIQIYEERK